MSLEYSESIMGKRHINKGLDFFRTFGVKCKGLQ